MTMPLRVTVPSALLLLACFPNALPASDTANDRPSIVFEVPDGIDVDRVVAKYGFYGRGLCMGWPRKVEGSRRLEIAYDPSHCSAFGHDFGTPESVKVAAYFPGFRVATLELAWDEVERPTLWAPELLPLTTAPVHGQLIDQEGEPLAAREIHLSYLMLELMPFFQYADGGVRRIELGSTTSDATGHFWIELPWLLGDPFFKPRREVVGGLPPVPNRSVKLEVGTWSTSLSLEELYDESLLLRVGER